MVKGFIFFKGEKIPFVIENYHMELFTDEPILSDFCNEYNRKDNYILHGKCFDNGIHSRNATFLVEYSTGGSCYLRCYIINMFDNDEEYDVIGIQSPFLDDVFRYRYNYIEMVRRGINFSVEPKEVYTIPFTMQSRQYTLSFHIGYNNHLGLLEDYDKKGEIKIPLHTQSIQECSDISVVLYRLSKFMISRVETPFKQITLYRNGIKAGWFYCPMVSEESVSGYDCLFCEFDVMKYIPKIINNIALDAGNKITKSVPLGHLGNFDSMFSPQRFVEQIMAFEYLFDKLEPEKAQNSRFPLVEELKLCFNMFPEVLTNRNLSVEKVCVEIKEIRRTIAHGYAYYYDFKNDTKARYYMMLLDKLIRSMSLKHIGFSDEEIREYIVL